MHFDLTSSDIAIRLSIPDTDAVQLLRILAVRGVIIRRKGPAPAKGGKPPYVYTISVEQIEMLDKLFATKPEQGDRP